MCCWLEQLKNWYLAWGLVRRRQPFLVILMLPAPHDVPRTRMMGTIKRNSYRYVVGGRVSFSLKKTHTHTHAHVRDGLTNEVKADCICRTDLVRLR